MSDELSIQTIDALFSNIKNPAWHPKADRHGGSLWIVRSPRLGRKCHFQYDLEWENWLMIEFNPQITWFCEHPLSVSFPVEGLDVTTIFDMLILEKGVRWALQEIKWQEDIDPDRMSDRVRRQLAAQRGWTDQHGVNYELLTEVNIRANPLYLANLKKMIPYLRNPHCPGLDQILPIIKKILRKEREVPIGAFEEFVDKKYHQSLYRTIVRLLWCGEVSAPLKDLPFDRHLSISFAGEQDE